MLNTNVFLFVSQVLLFVQEELWTAIEAEVLDATGEIDIACQYTEALHGAYVTQVDNHTMWQWLNILAPCRVPVGFFVTVNHIISNPLAKSLGIGIYNVPLVLVYDIAVLVNEFNLADARMLAIIGSLHVNAKVTQCLYTIESKLLPAGLVLYSTFEDTVILVENRHAVIVT